jgi:hypothetical protein
MQDVEDEPLFAEWVAGMDIAKAGMEVIIRVYSDTRPGAAESRAKAASRSSASSAQWPCLWVCAGSSGSANVCAREPARLISSTRRPLARRITACTLVRS